MGSSQSFLGRYLPQPSSGAVLFTGFLTLVTSGLGLSTVAFGRDYFVSPGGDDNNSGTIEQPWKSIGKINSFPFQPGDNILFERGGIWREPLVIPTSGTKDNFISYGAYPDDPLLSRPVISCAKDISNVLWPGIIANGGFEDVKSAGQCPQPIPGWTVKSSSGHECAIENSGGSRALKLTNLGGNTDAVTNEFNLRTGGHYSLEVKFKAVDSALVHIYLYRNGTKSEYLASNTEGRVIWREMPRNSPQPLHSSSSAKWSTLHIPFTSNFDSSARLRVSVRNKNASALFDTVKLLDLDNNYWSVNTENVHNPRILIKNGKRLSKGMEHDSNRRWHFTGRGQNSVRYIPDSKTPAARIELGNHRTAILLDMKSWIRARDLEITGCEAPKSDAVEGAGVLLIHGSSNNMFSNLLLTNNAHGIRVQGKGKNGDFNSNNIFEDIEVAYGLDQGIALRSEASHNIIRNSIVHHLNTVESDHDNRDKEGISIGGNTGAGPGNIVEHNEVHSIGTDARGSLGIVAFNSPGTIIRNNYVHDIGANGIGVGTNGKSTYGFTSDNSRIYSNLIVRTGVSQKAKPGQGIHIMVSDHGNISGTRIYNNTITDCTLNDSKDGGISIRGVANPDGTVNSIYDTGIFNNIVSGCTGTHPSALYIGDKNIVHIENLQSDNNLFFPSPAIPETQPLINYIGKRYGKNRFPSYRKYSGLDDNTILENPMFKNITNDDYRLRPESPAINSGKYILNPTSSDGELPVDKPNIGAL